MSNFMSWFSKIFSAIAGFLNGSEGGRLVKQALVNIIDRGVDGVVAILVAEAKKHVARLEGVTALEGPAKGNDVRDYLKAFAMSQGLAAGNDLINLAIELALQSVRPKS